MLLVASNTLTLEQLKFGIHSEISEVSTRNYLKASVSGILSGIVVMHMPIKFEAKSHLLEIKIPNAIMSVDK